MAHSGDGRRKHPAFRQGAALFPPPLVTTPTRLRSISLCGDVDAAGIRMPLHRFAGTSRRNKHCDDRARTALDPSNPDQIYLTSGVGAYVTQDGGTTWEHRTTSDHEIGGYPDCLVIHPRHTENVFVAAAATGPGSWHELGTAGSRISKTVDGGRTWTTLRDGLPNRLKTSIQALTLEDWGDSFSLFAATNTGEVWAQRGWRPTLVGNHHRHGTGIEGVAPSAALS